MRQGDEHIRVLLPPSHLKQVPGAARLVRVISDPKRFHRAELHALDGYLSISVHGCATACAFVIVAYSPRATDHQKSETQAFAANEDGSFFGGFLDKGRWMGGTREEASTDWMYVAQTDYDNAAFPDSRVFGAWNPGRCLARLLGKRRVARVPPSLPFTNHRRLDGEPSSLFLAW